MISATYICPVRGMATLEPPEPTRLGQAARVAKGLGLERLMLPVLEESLLGTSRAKVVFLDGLIQALDQVVEAGLTAWLIAPAQRVLGLDWCAPYLVKPVRDPEAGLVFVDGRVRNLRPIDWWEDPSLIQKRIRIFGDLVAAVSGHSALTGWVILDRALEWSRPDVQAADLVLRSFMAGVREHDESGVIYLGLGWSELLDPEIGQTLTDKVDGLRISGGEKQPAGMEKISDLAAELLVAAYFGTLGRWLFGRPTQIEIGWGMLDKPAAPEDILEAAKRLAGQGLAGVTWLSLADPDSRLCSQPPWVLRSGLERIGLLDQNLEPKEQVEACLNAIRSGQPGDAINDFIDISAKEYMSDPHTHLSRLWQHFRESS